MLAYLRYVLMNYLYQDMDSLPSHEFYQLLTSEHLETFHAAFYSLQASLEDSSTEDLCLEQKMNDSVRQVIHPIHQSLPIQHRHETLPHSEENLGDEICELVDVASDNVISTEPAKDEVPQRMQTYCNSPTRSDEGYGSFNGDSFTDQKAENEMDETKEEIAALGIIDECDEVPDYGVALEPADFTSISPHKSPSAGRRSSSVSDRLSPGASPTKERLADLMGRTPKPRRRALSKSAMSENARNLLTMGYTLSLLGEKFEKPRSIEGSVKSVILRAGQAIEKSQVGSVRAKSKYGGSRYAGSRFGGSKRSVARSIVLEETLPDWGF